MKLATDQPILVVAGTDTEIGKTTATCALLRALRRAGLTVRGIKPVESGTADQPSPEAEDGRRLACAADQPAPTEAFQRLQAPLAPPVAADDEGIRLLPEKWLKTIRVYADDVDLTFVEGAGGLLSPLAPDLDTRQLAKRLDAPVLLVAADRLGTLNHTLLTLESLAQAEIPVAGVVFSAPEIADDSTGRNAAIIADRFPALPVATLPRLADGDDGAAYFADWANDLAH